MHMGPNVSYCKQTVVWRMCVAHSTHSHQNVSVTLHSSLEITTRTTGNRISTLVFLFHFFCTHLKQYTASNHKALYTESEIEYKTLQHKIRNAPWAQVVCAPRDIANWIKCNSFVYPGWAISDAWTTELISTSTWSMYNYNETNVQTLQGWWSALCTIWHQWWWMSSWEHEAQHNAKMYFKKKKRKITNVHKLQTWPFHHRGLRMVNDNEHLFSRRPDYIQHHERGRSWTLIKPTDATRTVNAQLTSIQTWTLIKPTDATRTVNAQLTFIQNGIMGLSMIFRCGEGHGN